MLDIQSNKDISISRGDHRGIKLTFKSKSGNPVSFSDDDGVYFTVKASTEDKNPLIRKKIGSDGLVMFQSKDTLSLPCGVYVWDLTYYDGAGERQTLTPVGKFVINKVVG